MRIQMDGLKLKSIVTSNKKVEKIYIKLLGEALTKQLKMYLLIRFQTFSQIFQRRKALIKSLKN